MLSNSLRVLCTSPLIIDCLKSFLTSLNSEGKLIDRSYFIETEILGKSRDTEHQIEANHCHCKNCMQ